MEIGEIISDAIHYPLNHINSLLVYIVIMFVIGLIGVFTGVGVIIGQEANQGFASGIIGLIGLLLILIIALLVNGYGLDIIKLAIDRSDAAPEIDIANQVIAGLKYLIVSIVYCIIPFIVMALLSSLNDTLGLIVGIILFIIFGLALIMGECRLANTGSLGEALNIPEAIKDLQTIGILKTLIVLIIAGIIVFILNFIAGLFGGLGDIGSIISAILTAIIGAYTFFFTNRAIGLLYSDA
ncbi:MAG: DUF4013 domain-containing protein [Methanobrevibacter olleyae]|uniref:DUF4013 domain-containing protein n=1 Tax=Methanobrevibacter olleyae TaxID=294671 RepID=A0A8T3VYV2_METOL|nr:DUF4013 domain-containing protein [Methanobrevibacter olleyae]